MIFNQILIDMSYISHSDYKVTLNFIIAYLRVPRKLLLEPA